MKRNDYRWFGRLVQLFLHPSLTLLDGTPKTHSSIQIWCCELVSLPFAQHNVLPYLVLLTNWNKMQTSQHSSFSYSLERKTKLSSKRTSNSPQRNFYREIEGHQESPSVFWNMLSTCVNKKAYEPPLQVSILTFAIPRVHILFQSQA